MKMDCIGALRRRKRARDRWKKSMNGNAATGEETARKPPEDEHSFLILFKENSTIHGVRDLCVSPRKDLKIIWIVLLVITSALTIHGCRQVVSDFMERKVVVSYFVHSNDSLEIPDLMICPLNRFNRSFFAQYNMSLELRKHVELSYPGVSPHGFQQRSFDDTKNNTDALDEELEELLTRVDMTFTAFITNATLTCQDFFGEEECKHAEEVLTFVGKCFRLPGITQTLPGYGQGRKVVVKLPTDVFHPGSNNLPNDGLILKLVARTNGIDNDLVFIPAGEHTLLSISATQYNFLHEPPDFMCNAEADKKYSRVWCFESCLMEKAEEVCNCSLTGSMGAQHSTMCTPKELFKCYYPKTFFGPEYVEEQRLCKARCKMPCDYWTYGKTLSHSKFSPRLVRELTGSEEDVAELSRTVIIEAFYTELEYTLIKHIRNLPLSSAIAQFGGQLSLWAGASVTSVAQLIIYFLYIFVHHCFRMPEHKRQAVAAGRRLSKSLKTMRDRRTSLRPPGHNNRRGLGGGGASGGDLSSHRSLSPRCAEEEMMEIEEEEDEPSIVSRRGSIMV